MFEIGLARITDAKKAYLVTVRVLNKQDYPNNVMFCLKPDKIDPLSTLLRIFWCGLHKKNNLSIWVTVCYHFSADEFIYFHFQR